jgi:hypothetical protein
MAAVLDCGDGVCVVTTFVGYRTADGLGGLTLRDPKRRAPRQRPASFAPVYWLMLSLVDRDGVAVRIRNDRYGSDLPRVLKQNRSPGVMVRATLGPELFR